MKKLKVKTRNTKSKLFNTIAIIGVGLIGGSIGLAVKNKKLADKVIGLGRSELSLKKALKKGAVDEISIDKAKVKDADLVILATPVGQIIPLIKEILPHLKKGTLVTDVGSTKRKIMYEVGKFLPKNINFIGGHPLAGSEKSGVEFADKNLFQNSICFLIPDKKRITEKSFEKTKKFWEKLGAKLISTSAEEHDFLVAGISHLPHIVSIALINSVSDVKCMKKDITEFAGQGWKDTTRISAGSPEVWLDILSSNADKLLVFIKQFDKQWQQIKTSLQKKNWEELISILKQACKESSISD